jgi:tRNA(Arg) A34 adenosine deaminase TadA
MPLFISSHSTHQRSATNIFGNYEFEHYRPFLNVAPSPHPKFLDKYLDATNPHRSKLHVAIIVKRGKILAEATNELASRTLSGSSRGSMNYIHAERNVIRELGNHENLRGADLYVMRISKQAFMYSQPCPQCTVLLKKCMKTYGLKNVYFTT